MARQLDPEAGATQTPLLGSILLAPRSLIECPRLPALPLPHASATPAPAPAAAAGERRYTEEELALILNRAAERQEGVQASTPRYTLADIQEIAAGAGIAPEHVSSVAAGLGDARAAGGGGVLGAPHRFRFEESIEGELADDVIGELFDLVRRTLGAQGQVTEALGTVEWKGRDTMGWSYVSVARRGGRTTIGVLSLRTDAAGVAGSLAGTGAVIGSLALGSAAVSLASVAAPIAAATGIGAALGGVWIVTRLVWRRYARGVGGRIETLGSALVAAARSAVEDGRVRGR